MAVTDSVNQAKSDKDPTEWLPPLASYRCTYLSNWVAVKVRWSLRMDQAEYDAVKAGLAGCGSATVTSGATLPTTVAPSVTTSQTTTQATSQATTQTTAAQVTSYVTPGAFCSPYGATGQSSNGVSYTCKPSDTEARNRWRR